MQRPAAGSLRVSLKHSVFYSPKTGGQRVEKSLETVSAVSFLSTLFTTGFPLPVSTRTSSAGMIRLRRTGGLGVSPSLALVSLRGVKRRSNLGVV